MNTNQEAADRVLIAEDDAVVRRTLQRILERAGFHVTVATDGEEAFQRLRESECDVVVSDVVMPRRDGMGLLRALRGAKMEIPVVFMSGHAAETDLVIEALGRGVCSYLRKPFEPQQLTLAVEKALRRHRSLNGSARDIVQDHAALDSVLTTLTLHRQPIVRWSARRIEGYECLLRASEPRLPHPGAILGAAERLGRVHQLSRAVREQAAATPPPAASMLFVNLHPDDLQDETLYDPSSALAQMAGSIVFEITERATLGDLDMARRAVGRLREMGFGIALDDIGAGFASLSMLTVIEPDIVKLDMSLVRDIDRSQMKRMLVSTVTSACRDLSIAIVAEGVETPAELETLVGLGCDVFQGYLFAKPAPGFPGASWDV